MESGNTRWKSTDSRGSFDEVGNNKHSAAFQVGLKERIDCTIGCCSCYHSWNIEFHINTRIDIYYITHTVDKEVFDSNKRKSS